MAVSPVGVVDGAVWYIDARRGTGDLSGGGLDPSPTVRWADVGAADPSVFAAHTSTDITNSFTTPHAAGLVPSGDIDLRARVRVVGDAEAGGAEDWSCLMAKIKTLNTGVSGHDEPDYALGIGLAAPFTPGEITLIWHDNSNVQHSVASSGAGLDPYVWNEVRATLDVNNGASGHTVRFYVGDGAGGWSQVGSPSVVAGVTTIRNNSGPLTAASFSVVAEYAEARDGIGGSLMASFRPVDAAGGVVPGGTWTAATSGETWTAGTDSAVLSRGRDGWLIGGSCAVSVDDAPTLAVGTGDWSFVFLMTVAGANTADNSGFEFVSKQSGVVGVGGTGWRLTDFRLDAFGIDGFGMLVSDGADIAAPLSNTGWSAGQHLVAVTLDRDGNAVTTVDGTARGSGALGAVGSLTAAVDAVFGVAGSPPWVLSAAAQFDRVLSAEELARVSAELGV